MDCKYVLTSQPHERHNLRLDPAFDDHYCFSDLRTEPCKSIYCVSCNTTTNDGKLHIIAIYLAGTNENGRRVVVNGSLPTSFGNLNELTYLDLSNSVIHGTIPSTFVGLASLETLNLQNNDLTGTLPAIKNVMTDCD